MERTSRRAGETRATKGSCEQSTNITSVKVLEMPIVWCEHLKGLSGCPLLSFVQFSDPKTRSIFIAQAA